MSVGAAHLAPVHPICGFCWVVTNRLRIRLVFKVRILVIHRLRLDGILFSVVLFLSKSVRSLLRYKLNKLTFMTIPKTDRGFTLPELMVVVAIMGIMVSMALPSFKATIQSSSVKNAANSFMDDMRYARSEAVKRNSGVVMCRTDLPETTNPQCSESSSKGWESGWLVFNDIHGDGTLINSDAILRVHKAVTSIDKITEAGDKNLFTFTGFGRLKASGSLSILFGGNNFTSDLQRTLCISLTGYVRVAGDGTKSCN